ncbi:hypothetical protein [uncultured Thiothrix sp.]|uniref:hypothetical protein n=1 Tax=uncultured Thiothrix sp. TaxID=223185 RepID=UPI002614F764|nr:hypothetical protein [uncultured Thiothrix sp.]
MMQYQTHADFMPSLRNFYLKNGNYRKAANKVLAAWAKSQNQEFFSETQVFQGFNMTHHGENRLPHCFKYDLHDASRLVTQQYNNCCTFLFVGTHEETEEWLNKNNGLIEALHTSTAQPVLRPIIASSTQYTKTHLQQLRMNISNFKVDIAQYEAYFKDTDINLRNYDDTARKMLVSQFHTNNTIAFKNQLNSIKQLTKGKNTQKAIEQAESLELFTDFIKVKLRYIATLQEYLEVSKNLH